jgi:dethiobiotin synthetase
MNSQSSIVDPQSSFLVPRSYFITGTDTGVGKTMIACALLHAFAQTGKACVGMKPVAAGCERTASGIYSDDLQQLRAASSVQAPPDLMNPYALEPAIAPHIAARQTGIEIDLELIIAAHNNLCGIAEIVVVEGVGGFRVPLNSREDSAELACRLNLPIILVVGMRLGCLNHSLLTVEAIHARKLRLAGWIANQIDPRMEAFEENVAALEERIPASRLATVPFQSPARPERMATYLWPIAAAEEKYPGSGE